MIKPSNNLDIAGSASVPGANETTWKEAREMLALEFSVRLQHEADRFLDLGKNAARAFALADASGEHFLRLARNHEVRAETYRAAAALIAKQGKS